MAKNKKLYCILVIVLLIMVLLWGTLTVGSQNLQGGPGYPGSFSYQGELKKEGVPINGIYDFQFKLFNAASGGEQIGDTQLEGAVPVSQGIFTVLLDFGSAAFQGDSRWLEVSVKEREADTYTTLHPRQLITPTPYALHAFSVADGAVTTDKLAASTISYLETMVENKVNESLAGLQSEIETLNALVAVLEEKVDALTGGDSDGPLRLATGGTGGTYYPLGGAIATTWNNHIGTNVIVQSTGASVENLNLLHSGEVELAMAMNSMAIYAIEGDGPFANPLDFTVVGTIFPEVLQIVAHANSGINTAADLVGKRVAIGPPGSGTASIALKLLDSYGIDLNDIDIHSDTFFDAADRMRDGQLDAVFSVMSVPSAAIVDLSSHIDINIVNIEGEGLASLLQAEPSLSSYEISAGTYPGQDEDVLTVAQWATLYASKDLDDNLVYNLTKIMYEQAQEIASIHAAGNRINVSNIFSGIGPVPIHPGALMYYTELMAQP